MPATMSVQRLPTETWTTILRYAISVPIFFETNPAEIYGIEDMIRYYDDYGAYYESERTRNILRRVCTSWNKYLLSKFAHRYVHFADILHGRIPIESMYSAIRINTTGCTCEACCNGEDLDVRWEEGTAQNLIRRLVRDETKRWKVEIVEGGYWNESDLEQLRLASPRLSTLMISDQGDTNKALTSFPNLTFVTTAFCGEFFKPVIGKISLSRLTTLYVEISSLRTCATWSLPSLKYFSFVSNEAEPGEYVEMLRAIGSNLLVLFDVTGLSNHFLPDQIWDLCPKLQKLQTSFMWPPLSPIHRSLRSIRLEMASVEFLDFLDEARLPVSSMKKAGVTSVGVRERWSVIVEYDEAFPKYINYGLDHGLSLYDIEGTLYQDFVVMLIRAFWRREKIDESSLRDGDSIMWF